MKWHEYERRNGVNAESTLAPRPLTFDRGVSAAEFAAAHGLQVSGARPPLVQYGRLLWGRRHFIVTLAGARLAATYSTARLGQIWQLLTPVMNAGVYYLIFGILLATNRGIPNFIAYLCCGVFTFNFTQQAVLAGTRSIPDNLGLIRALHFPRACLPVSVTITQLQQLLFSMVALVVIVLATGEPITVNWLLAVPTLVMQATFNAGLAMIMARVGAKTTDMAQVMPFIMRTWMYMSGIFYSVTTFTKHAPHVVAEILKANPILVYIELMRYSLIDSAKPSSPLMHLWPVALGWAVLAGVVGFVWFWKSEEEYGRG
jgi:teichoic acid transport system permease protein